MDTHTLETVFEEAKRVREHAYAPYSHFSVGAAVVDEEGRIYTGCNVENASYGATICAERNAVIHAVAQGCASGFTDLVVVSHASPPAPPCALCLQVLSEFCIPELQVHLADLEGIKKTYTLKTLLPHPFGSSSMTEQN